MGSDPDCASPGRISSERSIATRALTPLLRHCGSGVLRGASALSSEASALRQAVSGGASWFRGSAQLRRTLPSQFLARPARCKLPARSQASAPARPCTASRNWLRARCATPPAGPGARRRCTNRPRRTPPAAGVAVVRASRPAAAFPAVIAGLTRNPGRPTQSAPCGMTTRRSSTACRRAPRFNTRSTAVSAIDTPPRHLTRAAPANPLAPARAPSTRSRA
jgi:hypothetical protein